jgi:hypothetical protein
MWVLLSLALAGDPEPPSCPALARLPAGRVSVAWVSPMGQTVGADTSLAVVRTSDLRSWLAAEKPTVGRMLQGLGMRRRYTDPKQPYKVTIFEVDVDALCRPVGDRAEGEDASGLPACAERFGRSTRAYPGCGTLVDQADGDPSLDVFRVTWRDAVRSGFCLFPAERFVSEGT